MGFSLPLTGYRDHIEGMNQLPEWMLGRRGSVSPSIDEFKVGITVAVRWLVQQKNDSQP